MTGLEFEQAYIGRRVKVRSSWFDPYEGIVIKWDARTNTTLVRLVVDDKTAYDNGEYDLRSINDVELLPDKTPLPLPG